MLADTGEFTVLSASDGQSGLDLVDQHKDSLAVITVDLRMPGMSGIEVARKIRADGLSMPIIALSAYLNPITIKECEEAGIDAYTHKPFEPQVLVKALGDFAREYAAARDQH